ncbi:MAG: hypothetical protein SFU56_12230 [Capsulimonadales bacterium]|nr:hypothetical protein [Capsulimonadales bacterium]
MRPLRCLATIPALLALFFGSAGRTETPGLPPTGVSHEEIARSTAGATLENLRGDLLAVFYPATVPTVPHYETRYPALYDRTAFLYVPRPRRSDVLDRLVTVHYRSTDTETAFRITRLVARLIYLHRLRFRRPVSFPRSADSADIWVNAPPGRGNAMGGETRTNQIYLFAVPERKPIEWVRTLCHEWGHLTLVAARGFVSPEPDAAGYLGERLFFKWLREDRDGAADDFTTHTDQDLYHRRQVAPLIEQFLAEGPGSPRLKQTDVAGMDYYIGAALALDETFGSSILAKALWSVDSENARALVDAVRNVLRSSATFSVRTPAWVPLDTGTFDITGSPAGLLGVADRPPLAVSERPRPLTVRLAGWKRARNLRQGTMTVTFSRRRSEETP